MHIFAAIFIPLKMKQTVNTVQYHEPYETYETYEQIQS